MKGAYVIRCGEGAYVGGSTHIVARWAQHRYRLREGNHRNPRLQEAWARLGEDAFAFEVLELCETGDLLAVEQRWLDRLKAEGSLFNVDMVAGSPKGRLHSPETRAKMSASRRGRSFSPETLAKMAAAKRGEKCSAAKVTEADVRDIRRRAAEGEPYRSIAADYGIADNTVCQIVTRRSWGHVSDAANDADCAMREAGTPTPPAAMAKAA
ncbi:NUMOD3 domain-containing DNA-binding protein [Brevundimonas viscosa]|uniref:Group I intron endonuclease n=1 Tax=Brevundimonas viscosa TaxID=871741 RepID=A0A1I6PRQ2_9CAUL|nr:NUMOD3 domain-containing DNA-binding protein [Brevundimonas viscosa]SFS42780.1 group I intron endonuclease [Brevundimonas viscosa]